MLRYCYDFQPLHGAGGLEGVGGDAAPFLMASLFKQGDLYYAQFFCKQLRPQRKRVPLKTTTKPEARRRLAELERRFADQEFNPWTDDPWAPKELPTQEPEAPAPSDLTLGDAVAAYLEAHDHLSPFTVQTYSDILSVFEAHVGKDTPACALSADHVASLLASRSVKLITKHKYRNHIGYLYRWLVRAGVLKADYTKAVRLPKLPEQAPKSMTEEQVEAFLTAVEAFSAITRRDGRAVDWSWIADVVRANVWLGLRRGEVCALQWHHVNVEARVLVVRNEDGFRTKSGKERAIPIPVPSLTVLKRLQETAESGPVFRTHQGEAPRLHHVSRSFSKFRKLAGLPDEINFHSTRHTALTRLAERGVPVDAIRQFAGHSSVTVTERYTKMRPDTVSALVLRAFDSESPSESD